jgi:hypothetical protein
VIGRAGDCTVRLAGRRLFAIKAPQEELHPEDSNRTRISKRSGRFLFLPGGLSRPSGLLGDEFLSESENMLLGECAMWIWIHDDGEIDLVRHVEGFFRR